MINFYKFLLVSIVSISFFMLAPQANAATISRPTQSLGLVGYWSFDVGKGTAKAIDMSGKGNHGTLTNMNTTSAWVGGKIGNALEFDGVNDFVNIGDNYDFNRTDSRTFTAWIKTNSLGSGSVANSILAKEDLSSPFAGWTVDLIDLGQVRFSYIFNNATSDQYISRTTNAVITIGRWYHVTVVYNNNTTVYYVDGISVPVTTVSNTGSSNIDTALNLNIGNRDDDTGGCCDAEFNGLIDEVRVYNRALSPDEIKRLYRQTSPQFNASQANKLRQGLVGMWTFDGNDMSGNTAIDRSGNANNGTLTNGPKKTIGKIGQGLYISEPSCVQVSQSPSINTLSSFTISLWAKPSVAGKIFLHKGDPGSPSPGWAFALTTAGTRRLEFTQSLTAGSINVLAGEGATVLGEWQYFTVTVDGSGTEDGVHFYRNGVKLSHTNHFGSGSGGPADDSAYGLKIGSDEYVNCISGTGNQMIMDEVRIYNRALTEAEIRQLYKAGSSFHPNTTNKSNLREGLVGHWSFDGNDMGTTSARDASGNNNTGWLINGTKKAIGKIGQALSFDGVDDYVDAGSGSSLDNGVNSISLWIYPNIQNSGYFFSKRNWNCSFGFALSEFWQDTNDLDFKVTYNNDISSIRVITTGADLIKNSWTHVVVSWDGSTNAQNVRIYKNGIEQSYGTRTTATGTRDDDNTYSAQIGDCQTNSNFNGLIDEVRVYNRALSPDEIKRLYNMAR